MAAYADYSQGDRLCATATLCEVVNHRERSGHQLYQADEMLQHDRLHLIYSMKSCVYSHILDTDDTTVILSI